MQVEDDECCMLIDNDAEEDLTALNEAKFNSASSASLNSLLKFEECFDKFVQAESVESIVEWFDNICKTLDIDKRDVFVNSHVIQTYTGDKTEDIYNYFFSPTTTRLTYQIIKSKTIAYRKSNELWKIFDKKVNDIEYTQRSTSFKELGVLIIGCGPVGLRLSIECALLGLKCTIVEKRDKFSRNNVLHLWKYTIIDLKNLGAKYFFGKFCFGSLDHISIRKLQVILLKIALLLGVQVHFSTQFDELVEPKVESNGVVSGWKGKFSSKNKEIVQLLSNESFDVIIGADGGKKTLPGFKHKSLRGKLAIGITANFVNTNRPEEAQAEEIGGLGYQFNQQFFQDLKQKTNGIDLENIVYYKDDTHYFVMTAKRQSLINKQVIKSDFADSFKLLAKENVNFDNLCNYAREVAYYSTNGKLSSLCFATNHYGLNDIAMFDFTLLHQSENASRIVERKGKFLLMGLIGDSLLEPFWPLGTGIGRGFLSALDTAWAIKQFANNMSPVEILCERESVYQLLSQASQTTLNKNYQNFTINPATRYLTLPKTNFQMSQLRNWYDSENHPLSLNENTLNKPPNALSKKTKSGSQQLFNWCGKLLKDYNLGFEHFSRNITLVFGVIINELKPNLINVELVKGSAPNEIEKVYEIMNKNFDLKIEELVSLHGQLNKDVILHILEKLYDLYMTHKKDECETINESKPKGPTIMQRINSASNFFKSNTNSYQRLTSPNKMPRKKLNLNSFSNLFRMKNGYKPVNNENIDPNQIEKVVDDVISADSVMVQMENVQNDVPTECSPIADIESAAGLNTGKRTKDRVQKLVEQFENKFNLKKNDTQVLLNGYVGDKKKTREIAENCKKSILHMFNCLNNGNKR